ncbi:hypothetical protein [Frankia sp. R82]|uniref:hypothetical protein n=1 Tax=Frankia sp. R82 TaxID=2950553 RepID=UPI0020430603|nr:hypothetical protein [Frankia sp. R82]MCM3883074.1 hypothetical protein [Frankia sp. R82]
MDEAIITRLRRAASEGPGARDRVCDEVAAELIAASIQPQFMIATVDLGADPELICADRYWRLRFLRAPTIETAASCARWLADHTDDQARARIAEIWALGYAFITRDNVESREDITLATGRIVETYRGAPDICYFAMLYHAGKLRADFWYDELHLFLDRSLLAIAAGEHREQPLFTALRAFASLGRGDTAEGRTLLGTAWVAPGRSRAVVDVCVHALDIASPSPGQVRELLEHATAAAYEFPDHGMIYRLARAQRLCGHLDEALASITRALVLLPALGSRISHEHFQERYIGEREKIQDLMNGLAAAVPVQPEDRPGVAAVAGGGLYRGVLAIWVVSTLVMVVVVVGVTLTVGDDWSMGARLGAEGVLLVGLLLVVGCAHLMFRRVVHRAKAALRPADQRPSDLS